MASTWETLLPRQEPLPPIFRPPTPEELAFNNAPHILGITGSFFALATITVLLRCYVRTIMLKIFGIDDWVMLLALVSRLEPSLPRCLLLTIEVGAKHSNVCLL
jgi:hypothetical protein